jgi:hypothetical protein
MKATLLRDMVGADLLQFFEDWYYARMPMGRVRRILALWRHVRIQWWFYIWRRVKLRWKIWFKPKPSALAAPLAKEAIQS